MNAHLKLKTLIAITFGCMIHAQADPPVCHPTSMRDALEVMYPDQPYLRSQFRGLNENGDAVGEVTADSGLTVDPFIFTFEHGVVVLPLISGYPRALALDLTDRDTNGEVWIVGQGRDLHDMTAAAWRFSTVTGEVLETRDVGNLPGYDEGALVAVNNNGIAVGHQGDWVYQTVTKYSLHSDVLEELVFPVRPVDINNLNQIVGGPYIGDLDGNYTDLPIPPDCTGYGLKGINDQGWVVGVAGRPYSDGGGRRLASWVRHTDAGWLVPRPGSPWDSGFAINQHGDITIGYGPGWDGGFYLDETGEEFWLNEFMPREFATRFDFAYAFAINDNQQVAASSVHAVLLTPTGRMIIPGDVNGDVQVNHDDHCAWMESPIDLDGDDDVDDDDEQWLIDRLAVFGHIVQDCNVNDVNDHCDITAGTSADCDTNDVPDECQDDCSGDGVPDACESNCNGNDIPDVCDIESGYSQDCNENGIPDECDGAETVEGAVVYDPPLWLYEDVHFVDSVLMTQAGTIADVDFTLHDIFRIGTLTVRLSHQGMTVTLIDRPGDPEYREGFVNLGYDITLDDQGSGPNIQTVGDFCCNFEYIVSPPSYKPKESLSAFNGLPREGIWTMEFIGGYPQAFDPQLFSWSVLVTDEAVDPGECCTRSPEWVCDGDVDGDGQVNPVDSGLVQAAFGSIDEQSLCNYDVDCDGQINPVDSGIVQSLFGTCEPARAVCP